MNLLMLSSSRCGNEDYLETARSMLLPHLTGCESAIFVPYAGVTSSWDAYTEQVQTALPEFKISGLHQFSDAKHAISCAQAILIGGGNTFHLLYQLYQQDLVDLIRQQVTGGTPYAGWSAGSNICGKTICTTNDMPIIQPPSFEALNLVPFQLNPHYTDYQVPGHNGETRAQRISEFCTLNPTTPVIGIKEGGALLYQGDKLSLEGAPDGIEFIGERQRALASGQDLSYLL